MLPTFSVPVIGPRQGKVWGTTQLAFAWNGVEAHSIFVKRGGYCSRHSHKNKWNRFVVLSGRLAIRLYHDGQTPDETIIGNGQVSDVSPEVMHEFEALEDTMAMELYWTVLDAGDIDRHGTVGGMKK